jgi:peroxiredoxin
MALDVGSAAPDFSLRNQFREKVGLADLAGSRAALVFIPYAFTRTCEGELCEIRDGLSVFNDASTRVIAITCNTLHANAVWAEQQGFKFDILSDFWPHGAVSRAYDTFNEDYGYAIRTSYFIDEEGIITHVVRSDELGVARRFAEYRSILEAR